MEAGTSSTQSIIPREEGLLFTSCVNMNSTVGTVLFILEHCQIYRKRIAWAIQIIVNFLLLNLNEMHCHYSNSSEISYNDSIPSELNALSEIPNAHCSTIFFAEYELLKLKRKKCT
jgi:hypothetical protein